MEYAQLIQIIQDSSQISEVKTVLRAYEQDLLQTVSDHHLVKIITGLRRSGKSYLLKRLYQYLVKQGIPVSNLLFLNWEHDLLLGQRSVKQLRSLYELFLTHANLDQPIYLFLDEIQNVPEWPAFVRTIYDSRPYHLYLTGSNSNLLSKEFASVLGGRILERTIAPFSFLEYLDYLGLEHRDLFTRQANRQLLYRELQVYLRFGGLVESFALAESEKLSYRSSLIDKIIIKDVVNRYSLTDTDLLYQLIRFLEENVGYITSSANLATVTNRDDKTIAKYLFYLKNTFLVSGLPKFSWSSKERLKTQRKYYLADPLFGHYASWGSRLEMAVYLKLIRQYGLDAVSFFKHKSGWDIDFLVRTAENRFLAYQVCHTLNDRNQGREIGNLVKFLRLDTTHQLEKCSVIYQQDERHAPEIPNCIVAQNALEFFLDKDSIVVWKNLAPQNQSPVAQPLQKLSRE